MFVIHYKCLLKACIKYLKNVPIGTHLFLMVYDSLNNTNFASYENPQDAEFPKEQDPGKVAPTPKKKGFMESLIEAKATEYMQSKMQTPEADNGAKGKDVPEPNIAKAPDNKSSERPRPQTWKPNTNGTKDPGMPNQDLMDGTIDKRSQNPNYNSNKPTYKGIQYNQPKINFPKIKGL